MDKEINYLNRIYEKNPTTGNYVVEISLSKYEDVFNGWDHADYKKRDLDPQLTFFLERCFSEIPLNHAVEICFYLPTEERDRAKEKVITSCIDTYYGFYAYTEGKKIYKSYQKTLLYIMASFMFLTGSFLIRNDAGNVLVNTLIQGATVGGWVFLWEALSLVFFRMEGKATTKKIYEKLHTSPIYFRHMFS
ncbi:hypothetical protein CEB3_c48980 [Peptococcaceae bacterium CEB3]|nr:hypothetical protein CEB3_c48980 [Peptococcaceae bacterium CEB3]